jgi:uncharacterized protein YutE (UPF0331/DUF86 family)
VFGDKIMMKYRRLPENISHLLPDVQEYLNKHPKVVFAYLKQMGEFSSVTLEEYSRDWKVQRIVERTLQMMIETCADIANHIISDRGYRTPDNYGDTFRVLHENGVLKKDLFEIMLKMARFRNRNFHFIYAGYRVAWIIPLLGGVRGGFLGREISVNISRITALPIPKSPPKRGLSNLTLLAKIYELRI